METLAKALLGVQKEITNAPTNSKNPFFNSKYTDLATAINHCRPVLAKHGLMIIQVLDGGGTPALRTILLHESGEKEEGFFPMSLPSDPQKAGSCITYFRRYSYLAMVGIAPEDDDGNEGAGKNGTTTKPPKQEAQVDAMTEAQHKKLEAQIKNDTLDRNKVKKCLAVKSMNELSKARASKLLDEWDQFLTYYQSREEA